MPKLIFGTSQSECFVGPKGEYRWCSNDNPIPLDCFATYGVETPACQAEEIRIHTDAVMAEYRASMENHVPSAEELFEMRAAFGPGAVVVNCITGKRTHL